MSEVNPRSQVASQSSIPILCLFLLQLSACAGDGIPLGSQRSELAAESAIVDFEALPSSFYQVAPTTVVDAPWGEEHGAYQRELLAAHTGPMAIAAEPDGGLAVVDTVGARVYRYGSDGSLAAALDIAVETADDLVVLPDESVVLLAYRRTPTPGYDLLTYGAGGALLSRRAAPQAASLPTALVADGERLLVEHRHEWLHPADGTTDGGVQWGRPVGRLQARARRLAEGGALLWTVDSEGQLAWELRIETPWPVTQILALEVAEPFMVLVLRSIEAEAASASARQQTWLVAVSHSGEALGRRRLVDSRVTDSGQPFAIGGSGGFYELVTDERGVRVLRYEPAGGAS